MSKRIIIVGKAASGKDHLAKRFIDRGFVKDVSVTTRPMREGEIDGVDYHYVSESDFIIMEAEGQFYEAVEFNGWKYGTLQGSWDRSDIFIMTPSGIDQISKKDRKECFIIWLDTDEEVRRVRLVARGDVDSIERRIASDERDFAFFTDFDLKVTNPDF